MRRLGATQGGTYNRGVGPPNGRFEAKMLLKGELSEKMKNFRKKFFFKILASD